MASRPKIPGTQFARPAIAGRSETVAAWKSLAFTAGLVALTGTALAFLAVHIPPFPPSGSGNMTGLTCFPGMADETVETDNPETTPFDLAPFHPNTPVTIPLPAALRLPSAEETVDIPSIPEPAPELADTYWPLMPEEETDPFGTETAPPAQQTGLPARTKKTSRPTLRTTSSSSPASRHANTALAQTEAIYGPGELDEQVRYKNTPMMPSLPPHLKTPNSARVRITVSGSGNPVSVTIIQSCGNPEVDTLLKHHILSHWTFHPAHREGKPVGTNVTTSLNFS
ncbi:hypothetical protein ICN84_02300 [Akkermansia glycaniphila]|uniref:energy transducer TonB n=1 Tax=Akkermansia glycaniphila TaxID=1679444 RepID=UPI001C01B938|nr:energy transducer TonB [Akkermansia glycaniphila]MBT9448901.1 hypothetical protein [Akkermansia glycaniphila]